VDFALTDEQRLVQEQARALLARHLPPEVARAQRAAGGACPPELWRVLADAGWAGYGLPRAHGGLGADLVDLALLFEECGRALVPARLRATVSAGLLLAAAGRTAELPALARGTQVAALAAVEPEAGADPARLTTMLSDGHVRGTKRFVVAGAEADLFVVAARGQPGLALALVPRSAATAVEPVPGWTGEPLATVRFEGAGGEVLAEGSAAERLLAAALARERVLLAAELVGGFARVVELTVAYVKERVQFGRPIGSFQAVQHQCADMATALEASRALVRAAAWRLAHGLPAEREVAIALAWTARRFTAATLAAHQLHGGMGFVTEYPLHLYSNRARAGEVLLGTYAEHLERVARARGL
jgi:alkylation response protein AidB-like acyl-CoA dehydrogenase